MLARLSVAVVAVVLAEHITEQCEEAEAGVCLLSLRSSHGKKPALALAAVQERGAVSSWITRQVDLRSWGEQHNKLKHELTSQHEQPRTKGWSTQTPEAMLQTMMEPWHDDNAPTRDRKLGAPEDQKELNLLRTRAKLEGQKEDIDGLKSSWLDDFVAAQGLNTEACGAKVLEAKRTLDGLSAKVLALSDAVEGHEAVIEGNTQLIRDNMENKENNDDTKVSEDQQCDDDYAAAILENQKYRMELDELDQMADPAVRSSIAMKLDVKAEMDAHIAGLNLTNSAENAARLAAAQAKNDADRKAAADKAAIADQAATDARAATEERINTRLEDAGKPNPLAPATNATAPGTVLLESCTKLAKLLSKVSIHHRGLLGSSPAGDGSGFVQLDCNATREGLQQEYTTAYEEISKLFNDGEALAEETKDLCKQAALDKHTSHDDTIDGRLTKATRAVQMAKDVITTFSPVLEEAKSQVEKLERHISDLQTTCMVDEDVTSHLKKVRLLIESLDKCPGRNDFKLTVPAVSGDEAATAAHPGTA